MGSKRGKKESERGTVTIEERDGWGRMDGEGGKVGREVDR